MRLKRETAAKQTARPAARRLSSDHNRSEEPDGRRVTLKELRARREEILAAAARWGGRDLRIFGSVARGEAGPHSDVDILLDMEKDRSLMDMGGLLMDLQDLLDCRVDL